MGTTELLVTLPGFRLWLCSFVQDEQFVFDVPSHLLRENTKNYITHIEGDAQVWRTNTGETDTRHAGHTTNMSDWTKTRPGRMLYTVLSPTYKFLCLSRKDERTLHAVDVRLDAGAHYKVPDGKVAIVVMGEATKGAGVVITMGKGGVGGDKLNVTADGTLILEIDA